MLAANRTTHAGGLAVTAADALSAEMCWNRLHSQLLEVGVSRPREAGSKLAAVCLVALCAACGPSEADIRREVRARLDADRATAPLALSIEVKRQVVYLSGKTATPMEQQQAVALAKGVKGVKLVVNDMWLNNNALADKVKEALGHDEVIGKIPIDVEAQGGLVRLSSDQTNREERERIIKIASAVEGVAEVEDRMK
jgi:hypothetical protein